MLEIGAQNKSLKCKDNLSWWNHLMVKIFIYQGKCARKSQTDGFGGSC